MTINDILDKFRAESTSEREKGTRFELLMKRWFLTDREYADNLKQVWMWNEFPYRDQLGGGDLGIDLVAFDDNNEYWAIQCKCYAPDTVIGKEAVDSFLSTSSKLFKDDSGKQVSFTRRIWISTCEKWGTNALKTIENLPVPVNRIGLPRLEESAVDWEKLYNGDTGKVALTNAKSPLDHQKKAVELAREHYSTYTRGKLIMACGTGKTYTSLLIAEDLLNQRGLVLFMVPSISLLSQSHTAWCSDAKKPIKSICVCSDSKAKTQVYDGLEESVTDLSYPASTNEEKILEQLRHYRNYDGLTVVFSTYQSIDVVSKAQQTILSETAGEYGTFDLIICDEAHRTTGTILKDKNESNFTKIHDDNIVRGAKRMYMTATPRLFSDSVKIKAQKDDCLLCSMDDEDIYGQEFFRVNFDYAVQNGLLTDYKVLVLTVNERDLPKEVLAHAKDLGNDLTLDDSAKLVGCINALSKHIVGDNGMSFEDDDLKHKMQRAIAFCSVIEKGKREGVSSKDIAHNFPLISEAYLKSLKREAEEKGQPDQSDDIVHITCDHIDGSMDSQTRDGILSKLKQDINDPLECRVVSNVRCLSEGVDVPALDAVLFLSSRSSQVDVVQSVGRVMRNFRRGKEGEKRFGYIIIPVVVFADETPEDALNDNERFHTVWEILNALRAHDDHFNAIVNSIALNKGKNHSKVTVVDALQKNDEIGNSTEKKAVRLSDDDVVRQLQLRFGELEGAIYARMVQKVGDRMYWDNWSKKVGELAKKFIERITHLIVDEHQYETDFGMFVDELQTNLNPSISNGQAIEMLAQHLITRPVFDALFAEYQFVKNNAVSRSMEKMLSVMHDEAFEKDIRFLNDFYENVKVNVSHIDNLAGKQTVIKNLYEKFFKGAFPLTVEQLGIVYTPVECVDFILHSVDDILKAEFNTSLTAEGVNVLDPFTGTGTFMTRLMQSGLIKPEDLERKYSKEMHCNEINLLAYYIADVNIESVFHDLTKRAEYLSFNNICLTDTFELAEDKQGKLDIGYMQENSEQIEQQKRLPIKVVIGNPPYSVGQKSANDNAQNLHYEVLEKRIADTYAKHSTATLKTSLYDSYIKAFRWASDRVADGGVVGFISNGAWLDGNSQDGFRKCLEKEFTSIYVFNLRGNCRTSGELRRKEGDGVFGLGSRTPIAITILVNNPAKRTANNKATIHYHDIGDYLSREQKLDIVKQMGSVMSEKFANVILSPNEHGDWLSMRNESFSTFPVIGDNDNKDNKQTCFDIYGRGLATSRDIWCYNSSSVEIKHNIEFTIAHYNSIVDKYIEAKKENPNVNAQDFIDYDKSKFSWDRAQKENDLPRCKKYIVEPSSFRVALYRPFFKQMVYFNRSINNCVYQIPRIFPTPHHKNLVICVCGVGVTKPFSCIITDTLPDLELIGKSQCFPLYWYESREESNKKAGGQMTMFDNADGFDEYGYRRHDGITDWILQQFRQKFNSKEIDKQMIFHYVYGLLHSPEYRTTFEADLKKMLPRIPIVDKVEDFIKLYKAGQQLASLHLKYEEVPPCPTVKVTGTESGKFEVEKMRFPAKDRKDTIIYNNYITIENIPAEAYEYIVNGKSAIEWIMERYAVTTDKDSQIQNNPNDWSREHNKPRYILDLLLSVINVSVQSVEIVKGLPKLEF